MNDKDTEQDAALAANVAVPAPTIRVAFNGIDGGIGLLQRWAGTDAAGVKHEVSIYYNTFNNNQNWCEYAQTRGGQVLRHEVIGTLSGDWKLEVSSTVVQVGRDIQINLIGHHPDGAMPYHAAGTGAGEPLVLAGVWAPYSSAGGLTTFTLPTPTQQTFTDVPTNSVFYEDIEIATALGIISGYNGPSAGTREFKPGNNVNRAQAAKMVVEGIKAVLRLMSGGVQAAGKKGK